MELSKTPDTREVLFQAFQTTIEESDKLKPDSVKASSNFNQIYEVISSAFTKQDLKELANKVYEAAKETIFGESYFVSFLKSPLVWLYTRIKSLQLKAIAYSMTTKNNITSFFQNKYLILSPKNRENLIHLESIHCPNISESDIQGAVLENEKKLTVLRKNLAEKEEIQKKNLLDLHNIQNRIREVHNSILSLEDLPEKLQRKKEELQALKNELNDLIPVVKASRAKTNSPSQEPSKNPSIDPSIKNKRLETFKRKAKELGTKFSKKTQEFLSNAIPEKLSENEQLILQKDEELTSLRQEISELKAYDKTLTAKKRAYDILNAKKESLVASIRENDTTISDLQTQVPEKEAVLQKVKDPKRTLTKVLAKQKQDDMSFFTQELQKIHPNLSIGSPKTTQSTKKVENRMLGHPHKELTVTNNYPIYLNGQLHGYITKTLSYGIDPKNKENPFLFSGKQERKITITTL